MRHRRSVGARLRQLLDQRRQHLDRRDRFRPRCCRAEAEAHRVERACVGKSHRLQHVRRLERARRAGRARRHRDAFEVERDQQRLGLDPIEADVGGVRHPRTGARRYARCRARRPGCPARAGRAAPRRAAPRWPASRGRSAAAMPRPAMPATFSVPARRLRSWRPPVTNGSSRTPRRIHRAPVPLGPSNLCAESDSRSTPSARDVDRASCRPSARRRCGTARRARGRPRRCAATGCTVPISLLACITETSAVSIGQRRRERVRIETTPDCVRPGSGRDLASRAWPAPWPFAARPRARSPETIRCRRPVASSASAAPRMAALSLSVPPAVKTTSAASAPMQLGHLGPGLVEHGLGLLAEMVDARRVAPDVARDLAVRRSSDGGDERGRGVVVQVDAHGTARDRNIRR